MTSDGELDGLPAPVARALRHIDAMTALVDEYPITHSTRMGLLSFHDRLVRDLDDLWLAVRNGRIRVDSMPVLRALRNVQCLDLWYLISSPRPDVTGILREVRLIRNMLTQIVCPRAPRLGQPSSCAR